jgi:hypothetical protein
MKKIFILLSGIATTFLFSCQKESDTPSVTAINGTWSFISMDATTNAIAETTQGSETDKTITQSNYTTENNSGTVTIEASTMTTNNLSYSVNAIAKAYTYQNNVLIDSLEAPFNFTAPPSSSSISYRFVGSDSIYFDQGSVFMNGATQASTPGGAKIKVEGDILYLTQSAHQIITKNVSGVAIKTDENVTIVIKLKKQ